VRVVDDTLIDVGWRLRHRLACGGGRNSRDGRRRRYPPPRARAAGVELQLQFPNEPVQVIRGLALEPRHLGEHALQRHGCRPVLRFLHQLADRPGDRQDQRRNLDVEEHAVAVQTEPTHLRRA
jgi:hypothetical protein